MYVCMYVNIYIYIYIYIHIYIYIQAPRPWPAGLGCDQWWPRWPRELIAGKSGGLFVPKREVSIQ